VQWLVRHRRARICSPASTGSVNDLEAHGRPGRAHTTVPPGDTRAALPTRNRGEFPDPPRRSAARFTVSWFEARPAAAGPGTPTGGCSPRSATRSRNGMRPRPNPEGLRPLGLMMLTAEHGNTPIGPQGPHQPPAEHLSRGRAYPSPQVRAMISGNRIPEPEPQPGLTVAALPTWASGQPWRDARIPRPGIPARNPDSWARGCGAAPGRCSRRSALVLTRRQGVVTPAGLGTGAVSSIASSAILTLLECKPGAAVSQGAYNHPTSTRSPGRAPLAPVLRFSQRRFPGSLRLSSLRGRGAKNSCRQPPRTPP